MNPGVRGFTPMRNRLACSQEEIFLDSVVHPLDLLIIMAYLGVVTWVGLKVSRGVHNEKDFFLAGRSLAWYVIGLSIIGTNISAEGYVGASGGAYKVGVAQANFEWIGAIPAMILASLIFIPVYWRAGVYSIPEYMGMRYNGSVRVLLALITSTFAVFAIAVGLWAMALTLQTYLDWPIWVGILVTGTVVGLYSIAGGLRAVAYTDMMQVIVMFAGSLVIVALGIAQTDGFTGFAVKLTEHNPDHLHAFLPADHADFPWPGVLMGLAIVLSPAYWCGSQTILQRTLGARTQWDASAAMMAAAFGKTLVPLLIVFPGLLALVMQADIAYPDMALPWVIKNVLPPGLSGLMFIALIAALQSTVDSALNSTSLMITRDIRGVLMKKADRSKDLVVGRMLTGMILVVAMLFAPSIGDFGGMYVFVQTLLSLFQGPTLALLVMGAFTRHVTPVAGLVTLVTGVALSGVLTLQELNMLYVAFLSFVYAIVCLIVVSFFTPKLPDDVLNRLVWRHESR